MIQGDEDIGDLLSKDTQDEVDNVKKDKINELLFCCQSIGKYRNYFIYKKFKANQTPSFGKTF